MTTAL